jgi:hypothetical protein
LKFPQSDDLMIHALDHFRIGKRRRELLAAIDLGDEFNFSGVRRGSMCVKGKPWLSISRSKSPPSEMKCMSNARLAAGCRATALAISTMRLVSARLNAHGAKRRVGLGIGVSSD